MHLCGLSLTDKRDQEFTSYTTLPLAVKKFVFFIYDLGFPALFLHSVINIRTFYLV